MANPPTRWITIHIFYAANPKPMLVDCVAPLLRRLQADGRLAGHFFVNYWLEGPHVRLRMRPVSLADEAIIRAEAEAAIGRFLKTRPALYEMAGLGNLREFYDVLFDVEFPQGKPAELIGLDGQMLLQPNNSFAYRAYEPEYGRYGGPDGVALAEWHFRHSTDLVLTLFETMNVHLRPVLLGTAAQLMMVMAGTFLPDRRALLEFLDDYHDFWHRAFSGTNLIDNAKYEKVYDQLAPALGQRFTEVLAAVDSGELDRLTGFLRGWARHAVELRGRVQDLATRPGLPMRSWDGREWTIKEPGEALTTLLSPYLHMTNNRFQVTIRDEAYLSYLLARVLRESAPEHAP